MSTQARAQLQTWQRIGTCFVIAFVMLSTNSWRAQAAPATELVMFDSKSCHVCKQFHREAAPQYNASKGARIFPLRMIDIDDGKVDIILERPVTMTPTFVFVHEGREIARIVGFPGTKYFYQMVDGAAEEMAKLQAEAQTDAKAKPEGL